MPLAVIRASAGSGKTYQLAVSFIRILLQGEIKGTPQNPAAILATTFTRAAAGEILDRVLRLLAEAALSEERRKKPRETDRLSAFAATLPPPAHESRRAHGPARHLDDGCVLRADREGLRQ